MTYRDLIVQLADLLGRHQVPVREDATDIHGFLGHDGVHHELISRIVRTIYRSNRCGHLDAKVSARATLDALAPLRQELLCSPRTDICQYRFMDALLGDIEASFAATDTHGALTSRGQGIASKTGTATVIALARPSDPPRNRPVHEPEAQDRQTGGE